MKTERIRNDILRNLLWLAREFMRDAAAILRTLPPRPMNSTAKFFLLIFAWLFLGTIYGIAVGLLLGARF